METTTIGLDLAKSVFQLHAVDAYGTVVWRKKVRRSALLATLEKVPPCLSGWRRVPPRIIGRARSRRWGTRCGSCRRPM